MLDGLTNLAENLDNFVKNDAISKPLFEKHGLHFVKPGLGKPGGRNYKRHFGRPLQNMVA